MSSYRLMFHDYTMLSELAEAHPYRSTARKTQLLNFDLRGSHDSFPFPGLRRSPSLPVIPDDATTIEEARRLVQSAGHFLPQRLGPQVRSFLSTRLMPQSLQLSSSSGLVYCRRVYAAGNQTFECLKRLDRSYSALRQFSSSALAAETRWRWPTQLDMENRKMDSNHSLIEQAAVRVVIHFRGRELTNISVSTGGAEPSFYGSRRLARWTNGMLSRSAPDLSVDPPDGYLTYAQLYIRYRPTCSQPVRNIFHLQSLIVVDTAAVRIQTSFRAFRVRKLAAKLREVFAFYLQVTHKATLIQSAWRGRQGRVARWKLRLNRLIRKRDDRAAAIIQSHWHLYQNRQNELVALIAQEISSMRWRAAKTIQAHWRGRCSRLRYVDDVDSYTIRWPFDSENATVEVRGTLSEPHWARRHLLRWNISKGCHSLTIPRRPGMLNLQFCVDGELLCHGGLEIININPPPSSSLVLTNETADRKWNAQPGFGLVNIVKIEPPSQGAVAVARLRALPSNEICRRAGAALKFLQTVTRPLGRGLELNRRMIKVAGVKQGIPGVSREVVGPSSSLDLDSVFDLPVWSGGNRDLTCRMNKRDLIRSAASVLTGGSGLCREEVLQLSSFKEAADSTLTACLKLDDIRVECQRLRHTLSILPSTPPSVAPIPDVLLTCTEPSEPVSVPSRRRGSSESTDGISRFSAGCLKRRISNNGNEYRPSEREFQTVVLQSPSNN